MSRTFGSLAFTPAVKKLQQQHGSRQQYERMVTAGPAHNKLTASETTFLEQRDSFYWASVGSNGWPYIQHRGGPKGFLKVIDDHTLAFADFAGNKQYITTGNLVTDDRVAMILVDYPLKARLKILGHASVLEADAAREWLAQHSADDKSARVDGVFIIDIEAYDWNCPQHITPRFTQEEVETALKPMHARIEKLEQDNAVLREELAQLRKSAAGRDNLVTGQG
jgi:predicted pyridoxine 5'-phosphate oxidase superfamily flavin-nucleotide-binding protein